MNPLDKRLGQLEKAARRGRKSPPGGLGAGICERVLAALGRLDAYNNLPVPEKIEHKRQELAQVTLEGGTGVWQKRFVGNSELEWQLRCRSIEIDIQELEGASADSIAAARWEANEYFRTRGHPRRNEPVEPRPAPVVTSDAADPVDDSVPLPTRQPEHGVLLDPPPDRLRSYRDRSAAVIEVDWATGRRRR